MDATLSPTSDIVTRGTAAPQRSRPARTAGRAAVRHLALPLALGLAAAIGAVGPARAGDVVPNRFIIVDEVFDFHRLYTDTPLFSQWNFGNVIGEGVATQAKVVFADDPGRTLLQSAADNGYIVCSNNDYLVTADVASWLTAGGPVILDLSHVLFEPVDFENNDWRLRSNWQTRLNTYRNRAAGHYNPNTTTFISVFTEVTGTDLTNSEIGSAATQVKLKFPGVKVAAGYSTGFGGENNLPPSFPAALDLIFTWDYTVADPNTAPYYNPSSPTDPNTRYGKLVQRLQGTQDIYFVVAGFNDGDVGGAASRTHKNTGALFHTLLRNWCAFALKKHPLRNAGLIVWKYNDAYGCTQGSCNSSCTGLKRTITGAQTTFEQEQAMGLNDLARAYRAVSRAAAFGEACNAP